MRSSCKYKFDWKQFDHRCNLYRTSQHKGDQLHKFSIAGLVSFVSQPYSTSQYSYQTEKWRDALVTFSISHANLEPFYSHPFNELQIFPWWVNSCMCIITRWSRPCLLSPSLRLLKHSPPKQGPRSSFERKLHYHNMTNSCPCSLFMLSFLLSVCVFQPQKS